MKVFVNEQEDWPVYYLYDFDEESYNPIIDNLIEIPDALYEQYQVAHSIWLGVQFDIKEYFYAS